MLLLLRTSIAIIVLHTSLAALHTHLYTYKTFGVEAANNSYFSARSNFDCVLACNNGYSPLLTTQSNLDTCWTVAIYHSYDSMCHCHNDINEWQRNVSSALPSLVLMLMFPSGMP